MLIGEVVAQVGVDGSPPVNVAGARPTGALRTSERAVHCLLGARREPALDLLDHLGHQLAGRRSGGIGEQFVQLHEQRDQMQIGLNGTQHLRFEQQLTQVQPIDGIALQHLHHTGREVTADVAQPARYGGR